jgi:hypothetical protein
VTPTADERVEVDGFALELAPGRAPSAWHQEIHPRVIRRHVDRRRVARLEDAQGMPGVGKDLSGEVDSDVARTRFHKRRARVIPDVLHA